MITINIVNNTHTLSRTRMNFRQRVAQKGKKMWRKGTTQKKVACEKDELRERKIGGGGR